MSNKYPEYYGPDDRRAAAALVGEIMSRGLVIAVHEGEDYAIKASKKHSKLDILKAMGSTDYDWLIVADPESRKRLGSYYLIPNNGSEGDPMILIADYSYNEDSQEVMESIYKAVEEKVA